MLDSGSCNERGPMTVHFAARFENETVELDDHEFDACTFLNCTLIYRGGALPKLGTNTFVGCQFALRDAALRTLGFFSELYATGGSEWVEMWFDLARRPELPEASEGAAH